MSSKTEDDVVKIILLEETNNNNKANHAPARIMILGYYYSITESVELSFISNLGTVTVQLENVTEGDVRNYVGDSSTGRMILSVSPNSTYRMTVTTENGRTYYALFSTELGNN